MALDKTALEKARTAAMGTLQMQLGGRDMKHPGGPGFAWHARLPEDGSLDIGAAVEAAILAYLKNAPISEEQIEAGARAICIQSVGGENYSDKRGLALFVDGNWKRYADDARACLSASRGKGE